MYWGGGAIVMAKNALKIFMHSLPEGSKFNICGFGSTHEFLFDDLIVDYKEETLNKALNDIETYDQRTRCLGGTEILTPLKHILEQANTSGLRRQIFLLTDGAVYNT